ncbi:anoctamin-6 isoform X1 [Bufo bufo]|uniref:anoctamin-6 isoform X1 n=1 Tax=Bufo bufo TaxID=8384 RepID=UPI001ABDB7C3|nr:anoctamin-6 isoform X1 [Bufo bufo]
MAFPSDETSLELDEMSEDGEMIVSEEMEQTVLQTYGTMQENACRLHTAEMVEFNQNSESLYFNDDQRRIDYILVYEDETLKDQTRNTKKNLLLKQMKKRQAYESNLMRNGLQLEATRSVSDNGLVFVKVHAPWEVLCTYAEVMHIKLPIQPNDLRQRRSAFNWFTKIFSVSEDVIKPEQEFFTAPFEKDRVTDFFINDRDLFFTPATRSRIVQFVLSRVEYAVKDNVKKFGIHKLLDSGIYKAAFPLHDCRFNVKSEDPRCPNERYLLYREWAHPRSFYKVQPLDFIRKYYGEKVGIYFAWLGFYTQMLLLAGIVGLCCFLYGYKSQESCTWSKEVCDPNIGGNIIMCPQCDKECTYWYLNITCESSKKLCIFDSFGTLVFAVFMGIWVTLFLEFWKRRQAELEYEWDTVEFLEQEEQPLPEYEAKCTHVVVNPITQQEEHVPYTTFGKCLRMAFCTSAVFFWILLIVASVVGIIVYRLSVFLVFSATLPRHINGTEAIQKYLTPQTATTVTASIISFIIIMLLNMVYEKVAIMITDFELPRTKTEYENSLTTKMFLFQFVNYYSSCFYIAFFKGKFVGYPGDPVYWFGRYRNEECDPGGCLLELTTQLTIIMGGKAIWNNIQEILLPWIKNLIARCRSSGIETVKPRWEQDYHLQPVGKLGLFYEYLEMVIQFGFVTLFVASFPLAPLLALVNNLLEIRVDAWKLTTQFRRMVPEKAQDIGAWQPIMQGVAILAVVTNAMIIAFTSDMIPRLVYYWSFSIPPYGTHSSNTMQGYINNTLSVFSISDFKTESRPVPPPWFGTETTCRYRDFRYPPGHGHQYEHSIFYWHVIAAKLSFLIVMEHIVYFVKFIISYVIPDVPNETKEKIKREKYLIQKLLHERHLKLVKKQMGNLADKILKGVDNRTMDKLD